MLKDCKKNKTPTWNKRTPLVCFYLRPHKMTHQRPAEHRLFLYKSPHRVKTTELLHVQAQPHIQERHHVHCTPETSRRHRGPHARECRAQTTMTSTTTTTTTRSKRTRGTATRRVQPPRPVWIGIICTINRYKIYLLVICDFYKHIEHIKHKTASTSEKRPAISAKETVIPPSLVVFCFVFFFPFFCLISTNT